MVMLRFRPRISRSPRKMAPPNTQNPPPKRKATEEPPSTPITTKKLKMSDDELSDLLEDQNKHCPSNLKIIPFPEKVSILMRANTILISLNYFSLR